MTYWELQRHIEQQIKCMLCFDVDASPYIEMAVKRTDMCLTHTANKYCFKGTEKEIPFSVYNSLQYCIFLYHMSRVAFEKDKNGANAEKFYYLNKIMHSVDFFYAIELPAIWSAEPPLGSVMGRAKYSDYFFFYQGCTVGGNKGKYPTIGKYVTMYSNSKILGEAIIGDNVIVAANTYIKNEIIPANSIVFGQSPNLVIKSKAEEEIKRITAHIWQ